MHSAVTRIAFAVLIMSASSSAFAQSGYQRAPDPIAAMIDVPLTPAVRLSPDRVWGLLTEYPSMTPVQ